MKVLWIIRALLLAAISIDLYLLAHSLTGSGLSGCGEQANCERFLATPWAYFLGLPVSLLALGPHLGLLYLSFQEESLSESGPERFFLSTSLWLVLLAAAWFISIQAFLLHGFCPYCLATHTLGSAAAILLLFKLDSPAEAVRDWLSRGLAALALLVLVIVQVFHPTSTVAVTPGGASAEAPSPAAGTRLLKLSAGLPAIPLESLPVLGNRNGRLVLVFFDFTCPNCRRAHPFLEAAVAADPNLAFVLIPLPINPRCNHYISELIEEHRDACDLARMAIAVWRSHPGDFPAFSGEVLGPTPQPPPLASASLWLDDRFGAEAWKRDLSDPAVETQLQWDVEGFGEAVRRSGHVELPKFVIGGSVVSGAPRDLGELQGWISTYGPKVQP